MQIVYRLAFLYPQILKPTGRKMQFPACLLVLQACRLLFTACLFQFTACRLKFFPTPGPSQLKLPTGL